MFFKLHSNFKSRNASTLPFVLERSKVAAYLRAYAFLVLQLAAATAMIIAVLGANWMQVNKGRD